MNFHCDHVDGRGATVTCIRDAVASDRESCAIGICLFGSIVYTHSAVGDILLSVYWDVIALDEYNGVGAFALAQNARGKAS